MPRLPKFESYRFIGYRKNMKVYDCDNPDHFKALEQLEKEKELVKNNQLQSFAPDSLEEAKNRSFKPFK
ncbi:hypothetical protein OA090_01620 [Acidimicrobiaceae bacterium]|nr:hypothetical protein [Acidimicrobiaceae bacterium]